MRLEYCNNTLPLRCDQVALFEDGLSLRGDHAMWLQFHEDNKVFVHDFPHAYVYIVKWQDAITLLRA